MRLISDKLKYYFFEDDWHIIVVDKSISESISDDKFLENAERVKKEDGFFLADPFAISDEDRILCEYYSFKERIGKIISADISGDNKLNNIRNEFETEAHLSYPFIFTYDKQIFCIPEMSELNAVKLYRYDNNKFKFQKVLLEDIDGVDTTFFEYGGFCWLALTKASRKFGNEQLHLFYSKSLFDSWIPHKSNPVKTDISSARCAGTPFYAGDALYRPAQNCEQSYGKEIVLNKIIELNPDRFSEESVKKISAGKMGDGVHTISKFGNRTLLDIKIEKFSIIKPFRLLMRKFDLSR